MQVNPNTKRCHEAFMNGIIVEKFSSGKKAKQISNELGISVRTLNHKWKRYREEGTLALKSRSGRPRKTSPGEDRLIVRQVQQDPFVSCKKILSNIQRPDLSKHTIRRRLIRVGNFKCRRAAKKPWLREPNRVKRLEWAQNHINWTLDQWRSVLWSDESKFEIRYHASRKVWRKDGQRYNPKNTIKTVKHDKSVMVWGCFSYWGVGRLYRINGIMKKEHYHSILQRQMIPSAAGLFLGRPWIFQQDNDPKHMALINKRY
jgi:transposase